MIELIGGHRFDEGQVVGLLGQVGNGVGHPGSALSVLFEFVWGSHQLGDARCEGEAFAFEEFIRAGFVVKLLEFGFVVEQVEMRRGTCHVQVNDPFGPGGHVGVPWLLWADRVDFDVALQELGEGNASQREFAGIGKKLAAGLKFERVHGVMRF